MLQGKQANSFDEAERHISNGGDLAIIEGKKGDFFFCYVIFPERHKNARDRAIDLFAVKSEVDDERYVKFEGDFQGVVCKIQQQLFTGQYINFAGALNTRSLR